MTYMSGKQVKAVDINFASSIKKIKLGFCWRLTTANSMHSRLDSHACFSSKHAVSLIKQINF